MGADRTRARGHKGPRVRRSVVCRALLERGIPCGGWAPACGSPCLSVASSRAVDACVRWAVKRRTFRAEGARAVVEAVAAELGLPVEQARGLVEVGAVYVAGRRCRDSKARLTPGQVVAVVLEEGGHSPLAEAPAAPLFRVLHEDADVLAVDKPAGLNAQPTEARVGASLVDQVSGYLGREAGLVHRLDRETSGVTVFGKTPQATSALAAEFREGRARKRYVAATAPGLPESGTVDLPLSKDPSRPGRWRATRA